MSREGLYRALGGNGSPSFSIAMKELCALGLKLHVEPQAALGWRDPRLIFGKSH